MIPERRRTRMTRPALGLPLRALSWVPCALVLFCSVAAGAADAPVRFTERERALIQTLSPPQPARKDSTNAVDANPSAASLGQTLFFDARLSADGRFSCASCHDPTRGWSDDKPVATAAGPGIRNTPSLWNVASNRWFFWDGRADSLWSQALKPIERDLEMNGSRLQAAHLIADDAHLRSGYEKVFGALPDLSDAKRFPRTGGPGANDAERQSRWWEMDADDRQTISRIFANIGKAIAAFEATLKSGPAPFDRFVADLRVPTAESAALSPSAQRGLRIFIGKGNCMLCHSGPLFTNMEFHDTRVQQRDPTAPDAGRLLAMASLAEDEFVAAGPFSDDVTGIRAQQLLYLDAQAGSRGHFKTPGLRNVALTAPYMHAGQLATLRDVVQHYNKLEDAAEPADPAHVEALIKPLGLSDGEVDDVVAFLQSLTGEPPNAGK